MVVASGIGGGFGDGRWRRRFVGEGWAGWVGGWVGCSGIEYRRGRGEGEEEEEVEEVEEEMVARVSPQS
ncbi:hypothetical protein HZH68_011849 [Vespula germanica]|uniref:Uncharacterized protein n=1 Tax=Vespula germanica TaxID=30212 RepID=A0A834JL03_VESGE|nr:hypothetical protein HZH68_011849 [Vespula germanica]